MTAGLYSAQYPVPVMIMMTADLYSALYPVPVMLMALYCYRGNTPKREKSKGDIGEK